MTSKIKSQCFCQKLRAVAETVFYVYKDFLLMEIFSIIQPEHKNIVIYEAHYLDGIQDLCTTHTVEGERIDPYLCTCICVTDRHVHCGIDHCGMWTCHFPQTSLD